MRLARTAIKTASASADAPSATLPAVTAAAAPCSNVGVAVAAVIVLPGTGAIGQDTFGAEDSVQGRTADDLALANRTAAGLVARCPPELGGEFCDLLVACRIVLQADGAHGAALAQHDLVDAACRYPHADGHLVLAQPHGF